jgi:hypothetical protein
MFNDGWLCDQVGAVVQQGARCLEATLEALGEPGGLDQTDAGYLADWRCGEPQMGYIPCPVAAQSCCQTVGPIHPFPAAAHHRVCAASLLPEVGELHCIVWLP